MEILNTKTNKNGKFELIKTDEGKLIVNKNGVECFKKEYGDVKNFYENYCNSDGRWTTREEFEKGMDMARDRFNTFSKKNEQSKRVKRPGLFNRIFKLERTI
jgi:hypothetical protein